jgi:hypothetical protein
MRVIVGTYRQREHVPAALASLDEFVTGADDLVFVDDSGDIENHLWLRQYGRVIDTGRVGYGGAMKMVCETAEGQESFFLEEDFTFLSPLNLAMLSDILAARPYLAQIALLRGPHFRAERRYGGVLEALRAKRVNRPKITEVDGIIEQTVTFTCNPAVWRGEVFASGWPDGKWSEDTKTKLLVSEGYKFGYLPGIRVAHHGAHTGFGY